MIRHMVAIDNKRGIAKDGLQPWKLPTDENYFREQTKLYGGVVLMGRKTFEVIGASLPGRQNFVLTRDREFDAEGINVIHNLDAFLDEHPEVWIVGGAELYEQTLTRASELYITEIQEDFGCSTFYPRFDKFTPSINGEEQTENGLRFTFNIYKPNKA